MPPILIQTLTAFCITLLAIVVLSSVAGRLGLIDSPAGRKDHCGDVPLVGGLAIFTALLTGALIWGDVDAGVISVRGNNALWVFLGCAAFLVLTCALDDRFHLGAFTRIAAEVLVSLIIIEVLELRVAYLGDLLGVGQIQLTPSLAYPFTVIAIVGIINAFNMLDGMDGLLSLLVLTTLATFHLFTETSPSLVTLFIGASLLAFLTSNLKLVPVIPKTFLGDAGSCLLGFIVVILLLGAASGQVGDEKLIQPATALFLVALPLYDMVFTTSRRVLRRGSPFEADRTHIHHLLRGLGFSDRRSVAVLVVISLSLNLLGLILHRSEVAEYFQLSIFVLCFGGYSLITSQGWMVVGRLKMQSEAALTEHNPHAKGVKRGGSRPVEELDDAPVTGESIAFFNRG